MRRLMLLLIPVLCAAACATIKPAKVDDVVAAERAFAAYCYEHGIKASFLKFSAEDAIVLAPGPANARATYSARPDPPANADLPKLVWWPLFAGVARSSDLGFTTGPYEFGGERGGFYFTVWRKQPDGGWKWIFDGGVDADARSAAAANSNVAAMAIGDAFPAGSEAARRAVADLESLIDSRARTDAAAAISEHLAASAWVASSGVRPSTDAETRAAIFSARPAQAAFSQLTAVSSSAGDLVWTFGEARDVDAGLIGHYARIWRRSDGRWRIVFDQMIPSS